MKPNTASAENENIRLEVALKGGAFVSLVDKCDGEQLMWKVDPALSEIWDACDVLLFPFCGRFKDSWYTHEGKRYDMTIHGFAKDSVFTVAERTASSLTLELKSSPETLKIYPFEFTLRVTYECVGRGVRISYNVRNEGKSPMYFGIGAHFGAHADSEKGDTKGNFVRLALPAEERYTTDEEKIYLTGKEKFDRPTDTFETDKAFFLRYGTMLIPTGGGEVTLERRSGKKLVFTYGSPYLALWSYELGGDYVCIEPWWGLCDYLEPKRELSEKEGINRLDPGKTFSSGYGIEVR